MQEASTIISATDCQKIAEKYFGEKNEFKVSNFIVEPISNSVGFMCHHYILKITIRDETESKELSFFLKLFNEENEAIAEFVKSGNLFNKEIACYKFFDKLRMEYPRIDISFAPKYYFSRNNKLLVLENLYETGYKVLDIGSADMDHIKVILASVAKFHASSLIFEEIQAKRLRRKYSVVEDYGEYLEEALLKDEENYMGYKYIQTGLKALSALVDQLPTKIPHSDFKKKMSELALQAYEDVKPSDTFRNVWSHGDLWISNVMFQYIDGIPVDCKIFDFQFLRYTPLAHDVLHMIYDSDKKEIYHNHLDDLLNHYLECLKTEFLKMGLQLENVSVEEFRASVIKIFPTIKLIKSIHKSITAGVFKNIIFDDPCKHVIQAFQTQEMYKTRMTSLIQELENVFIDKC